MHRKACLTIEDMVKERTGHQLVLTTVCLPGVQIGSMTAGELVDMVATVNMTMCLPMHGIAPDHSIPPVALMHILDKGCAQMACSTVTCLQSLFTKNPGGAVAGVVHQWETADHLPTQKGPFHTLTAHHPMLEGHQPIPKGGHPMWSGHLMQKDHGPHILSRPADTRSQHTGYCQQWSIHLLLMRLCSHPHHLRQGVS